MKRKARKGNTGAKIVHRSLAVGSAALLGAASVAESLDKVEVVVQTAMIARRRRGDVGHHVEEPEPQEAVTELKGEQTPPPVGTLPRPAITMVTRRAPKPRRGKVTIVRPAPSTRESPPVSGG